LTAKQEEKEEEEEEEKKKKKRKRKTKTLLKQKGLNLSVGAYGTVCTSQQDVKSTLDYNAATAAHTHTHTPAWRAGCEGCVGLKFHSFCQSK
jgi:hypothetical protein